MTPTQRTLKLIRDRGWTAEVVERWIPGAFIRRDYLNIIDIIALTGTEIIGVQSCGESFADHKKKIHDHADAAAKWLASGGRLLLIGWRPMKVKRGGIAKKYEPREIEFYLFDMGGPEMRTPEKQYAELRKRGRTYDQIRAIAVARDDVKLREYVDEKRLKDIGDLV